MARQIDDREPDPGPPPPGPPPKFTYTPAGPIVLKAIEQGLGQMTSDELPTHDKRGRYQYWEGGLVVWHPDLGAHAVWGDILTKYGELGGSPWGYPITSEQIAPDGRGRFNHFRNMEGGYDTSIYWTPETGAHPLIGEIRHAWLTYSGHGALGYPYTGEMPINDGGVWQRFENADYIWHPSTGAHEVHGSIAAAYHALGGSTWGYPTTDESKTPDGVGRYNHFRNVAGGYDLSIYWTPDTGAQPVYGLIRNRWAELGWENCHLKYPTGPEVDWPEGGPGSRQQAFQGGQMLYLASRNEAAPNPINLLHDWGSAGDLEGWVGAKLYADGTIEWLGHQRATGAPSYDFQIVATATDGAGFSVANAWGAHTNGTFDPGSRNADWYEPTHSALLATHFWDLQRTAWLHASRDKDGNLGWVTDVAETTLKFVIGSGATFVLGPVGGTVVVVGTLAGTLAKGGNIQGGLQLINGTLWLAGPEGTFVALLAAGVAKLITEERGLRPEEEQLASAVFRDKLDLGRIRITNGAGSEGDGGEDRPFVFPRFDGKTVINMGQWEEDPMNMKVGRSITDGGGTSRSIVYGEKFLHELVHAWQIQHGSSDMLVLEGMAKIFGEDYGYSAGKNFEDYDLEPQASIIGDWWGQTYTGGDIATHADSAAATGNALFGYVQNNLRTGFGSTV